MRTRPLCTAYFQTTSSSGQGTRPPQKHDDKSGVEGTGGNGNGNNNKNDDDDKLSALLLKAFLWMLTAYFFIAVSLMNKIRLGVGCEELPNFGGCSCRLFPSCFRAQINQR